MSDISPVATSGQPVATLPPGTAQPSSTAGGLTGGLPGVNSNTFLQLLVAQLKYQSPDNPTNSTQFLSQTATFQEVEQLTNLQTTLSSLVAAQQSSSASAMLGKQVTATDSSGNSTTGVVTAVQLSSSGPVLTVNGTSIPLSSVSTVSTPGSGSSGTTTTGTTTTGSTSTSGTTAT